MARWRLAAAPFITWLQTLLCRMQGRWMGVEYSIPDPLSLAWLRRSAHLTGFPARKLRKEGS